MVARTPAKDDQLERALVATSEQAAFDFKSAFNPASDADWCELLKDIAAMANSGGGVILVGLDDHGVPNGYDVSAVVRTDPARFADKIRSFTGENFDGISVQQVQKGEAAIAAIRVGRARAPLVFVKPGTYPDPAEPSKQQKRAFSQGAVYFRHGAKSEPGTTADLREFIDREVKEMRRDLLRGMRKIARAPRGSRIAVVSAEPVAAQAVPAEFVRPVTSPGAPEARLRSPDLDWPHVGKEMLKKINERLAGRAKINGHDIRCLRLVHRIDEEHPEFHYKSRTSAHQYSPAFLDWVVAAFDADPEFFANARTDFRHATGGSDSSEPVR